MSDADVVAYFGGTTIGSDFFRLICGLDSIGHGSARTVYACGLQPKLVIKFETPSRSFQNVKEWEIWQEVKDNKRMARWFAPCVSISSCGTVLIQQRTKPLAAKSLYPSSLPRFLDDFWYGNYGMIGNKFVCHDYGYMSMLTVANPLRMRKVEWEEQPSGN